VTKQNSPRAADALLTVWIVTVGVIYFGGYFLPALGSLTGAGAAFYAAMLLVSAIVVARRFLHRSSTGKSGKAGQSPPHDPTP
jgi:hypothetical protein